MAYRSSSQAGFTAGTTTFTGTMPSGVVAGDQLLAMVSQDGSGWTYTQSGATWTQLDRTDITGPDTQTISLWARVATGTDALTLTTTGTINQTAVTMVALSGRTATATPNFVRTTPNTSSNASPVSISLTGVTAASGDDLVAWAALDGTADTVSWSMTGPGSMTIRQNCLPVNQWSEAATATADNISSGATGSLAFAATGTGGSAGWSGYVINLAASGGAAPSFARLGSLPPGRGPGKQPAPNTFKQGQSQSAVTVQATGLSVTSFAAYSSLLGANAATGLSNISAAAFGSLLASNAASGLSITSTVSFGTELGSESDGGKSVIATVAYGSLTAANNASGQSVISSVANASALGSIAASGQSVISLTAYGLLLDASVTGAMSGLSITSAIANAGLSVSGALSSLSVTAAVSSASLIATNNASGQSVASSIGFGNLQALSADAIFGQSIASTISYATISFTVVDDEVRGYISRDDGKRRKSKHVIRNGQIVKEAINPSPIPVVSNSRVAKVQPELAAKSSTVQTAEDEAIVRATINLMFELL